MIKIMQSRLSIILTDNDLRELAAKAISDNLGQHIDKSNIVFTMTDMVIDNRTDSGSVTVRKQLCTATYEEVT